HRVCWKQRRPRSHGRLQARTEGRLLVLPRQNHHHDGPPPGREATEPVLPALRADERPHDGPQEAAARAPRRITPIAYNPAMATLERAEAAERAMSEELDRAVVKSVIYTSGERDPRQPVPPRTPGKLVMMGHDPRLARMPDKPTLFD